jgi:thiamine-monophosphate kinase
MSAPRTEEAIVGRFQAAFRGSPTASLSIALGDDAALWHPNRRQETMLTCDWFLEGTHFLRDKHPADAVGWKCLARAVSDIAAMGGTPRCFLLSLALPSSHTGRWLAEFLKGLERASRAFHCDLAGGDTTRRDEILITVTVIGEIPMGRAVLRSGARPGDGVFVSGILGEADLGLRGLRRGRAVSRRKNSALRKHLYPEPRLALGRWLAEKRLATAMMDLSDGLSTDLPHLCRASRAGALIEAALLPRSHPSDALWLALNGGDDYELLFTVKANNVHRLPRTFRGLPLTRIGEMTCEQKILLRTEDGRLRLLRPGGWDPFRSIG